MNADFGWSYPAGCAGTPDDEPLCCEVCGMDTDKCECPECPGCGETGRLACYGADGHLVGLPKPRLIHDLFELCEDVVGERFHTVERCCQEISRALFKGSNSGISFVPTETGIVVAGYCEGTDRECAPHRLDFPFTSKEFWAACDQSDEDGEEVWEETHGCERCWPDGCFDDCGMEVEYGNWPINPDCEHCHGEGTIL